MIPKNIFSQILSKSTEGLVLGSAPQEDGAAVTIEWCNNAFTKITGYNVTDVVGQRAVVLVGPNMSQGHRILIVEKLTNWEQFSAKILNNRKNGEKYWHQMTWVPLSDPDSNRRWWLYSLVELNNAVDSSDETQLQTNTFTDLDVAEKYDEKIQGLELEIAHLQKRATNITNESHEDTLTGLANRRHFETKLKSWVFELGEGRPDFAVLYIDLDRFKSVNDALGHEAGDQLLVSVAQMLCRITTEADFIARTGGNEFVILKPLGDIALNISDLADRIVNEIQEPFTFAGRSIPTSASIGVAIAKSTMQRPEQVVANAEMALYQAKSEGKGRWSFFTEEMHADLLLAKQLETEILSACDRREFIVFFQPIIDAKSGRISSAEALLRWAHPTRGLLSPASFLDAAAGIGTLQKIDKMVFERVSESLIYLDNHDVRLPRVAINASVERLNDPNLVHEIKNSGIGAERLVVEILESVSLEQMNTAVRARLSKLSDMGVMIAIDDFGTGFASIQGLFQIKLSSLKIERRFIKNIITDQVSRTMVSSMIAIGKSLDLSIVAEGIETAEHAQLAAEMGCDYLQGSYFGKPMSVSDLRRTLSETRGQFWPPSSVNQSA